MHWSIKESFNDIYLPNSALKKDIREITYEVTRRKVVAIFLKPRSNDLYKRMTYIAKDISINDEVLSSVLKEKVDLANLTTDFPITRKPEES